MSSENEDGRSLDKGSENSDVSKKLKISYSREFLLSLSNLDSCKKLPSGFVESLSSELEDALIREPDRPRIPGTFHGFRRSEYGVSPPTRGDSGNYSRGIHGKWDSRSSLRSDRDSDSQSDKDSDSGRRFGHQTRRTWQSPEHDGLLGSGSFPRPSGYASGAPAPKFRANDHSQLNRSNEPYHPPRPYKAVPHSRRDTDSLNDETFGSMECTSEDRAEAEKRRRASFETMRKEQQKTLQEKQKLNLEKHKGSAIMDTCKDLADSKEEKELLERNNELEVSEGIPILSNDLDKSSFASHSPASRPLVPPGFKSNAIEKSSGSKSLVHPPLSQVGKSATVESLEDSNAHIIPSTNSSTGKCLSQGLRIDGGLPAENMHPALPLNKGENANLHVSLDVPTKKSGKEDQLFQTFYQDTHATLGDPFIAEHPFIAELDAGILEDKNASVSNKISSSSILEKILGSTLSLEDSQSNSVEHYKGKPKDTSGTWSPNSAKSSKFAQWFLEEEANATTDVSSSMPNDLLSLIVSGDKGKYSDFLCHSTIALHTGLSYQTLSKDNYINYPYMPHCIKA
ncbi:eukaryotic translation initiation factor 4G [Striga asiatica]|uniref:Eukaryotic translation initiation factor 4G n=1 Tax=Striga asiatica TaxID=4170 RepID=A0A5A7QJC3_STRAF|nr:eukaryotic translation initiation factor 4G [Striga asiatica]